MYDKKLLLERKRLFKFPPQRQVAREFRVSERTIRRWEKKRPILKPGRKPKINSFSRGLLLLAYIPSTPTLTQQQMAKIVSREIGQPISRQTIARFLKKNGITRKKITYHYSEQAKNKEKVKEFTESVVPSLSQSHILAEDECGFFLNEAPRYGYSEKGKRTIFQKPGNKVAHYTLLLCIKNVEKQGLIHWELIRGGAKTKNFHQFLSNFQLPAGEKYCLLLDNARIHHATKSCQKLGLSSIKELATEKNIKLVYFPSYSPMLNPVELCFNFIRQHVEKCQARTEEKLRLAIEEAISLLQEKDLTQYFRHCWDYFKEEKKGTSKRLLPWFNYGQIIKPEEWFKGKICPSWRWLGFNEKSTFKDFRLAKQRIRECIIRSRGYKKTYQDGAVVWKKVDGQRV